MRLPRVSVPGLMGFVVVISFGLAALRFSTPNVAGAVVVVTLFGLGLAIIAAVYRRDSRRAFWIGFALIGWGYVGFSAGSWTLADDGSQNVRPGIGMGTGIWVQQPPTRPPWFGTTTFLDTVGPLVQAKDGRPWIPATQVASFLGARDPRSNAILATLKHPLKMPFVEETPLQDVLTYIKTSTRSDELPEGIPIYVDPNGLMEAEKTMHSPVTLDLDGVALGKSLKLVLYQLDLAYSVDDGLLTISNRNISSWRMPSDAIRVESFRRVGHSLFAVIFGLIGGIAARALQATRPVVPIAAPSY